MKGSDIIKDWPADPTPYMDELRISLGTGTADLDERALTDDELERAQNEGEAEGERQGATTHGAAASFDDQESRNV